MIYEFNQANSSNNCWEWINCSVTDWLWLIDWLTDWMSDWIVDCLADWLADWLTD